MDRPIVVAVDGSPVGSRGRGPIAGADLGSVSYGLLSLSRVPVLVAHAAGARSH